MSSHHKKGLHKRDKVKGSKLLSSTVLDYYYKYGQNRDLEKYLRLKRSNSKSSSESSSRAAEFSNFPSDCDRITKSMERLHLPEYKLNEKKAKEREIKSSENICDQDNKSEATTNRIKIQKKAQQMVKKKSKSYNLNLESSIEVSLPPSHSLPTLVQPQQSPTQTTPQKHIFFETSHTQTDEITPQSKKHSIFESSCTQTDAVTPADSDKNLSRKENQPESLSIEKSKKDSLKKFDESIPDTSPASSVASAKIRLEWDSMADIGYNKIIDFKSQSNSNLSTFEKNALTKFFAKRGLNFDDNLVIIAPCDKRSPLQKRKFTQSAVEMRETKQMAANGKNLSPTMNKQLWEKAIDKYRLKYGKPKKIDSDASTSGFDSMQFMSLSMAPHHSTPVTSKTNIEQNSRAQTDKPKTQDKCENTEPERLEKSCQTAGVYFETIGVQVDEPKVVCATKPVQTDTDNRSQSIQKDDRDLTTASSFEFLSPGLYKSPKVNDEILKDLQQSDGIPYRDDTINQIIHIQESNPDEKENIPPIEDKENIPPPPLHTMHQSEKLIDTKTPDQSIDKSESDTSTLPNNLQKGVDLINALIDSHKMDAETKKKLIRRIVRNIMKFKDTNEISQMIVSYSDKSKGETLNISSSTNQSDEIICKSAKQEMSGISTLSSSSTATSKSNSKHSAKLQINPNQSEIKDWLLPVTQSEIERENSRKSFNKAIEQRTKPSSIENAVVTHANNRRCQSKEMKIVGSNEIFDFLENEKKTHFNWIDQEIEHLESLKLLLRNIKINEIDESKENISEEKINSVYAKHNKDYLIIYENFDRANKDPSESGSRTDDSNTLIESTSSSRKLESVPEAKATTKSRWMRKSIPKPLAPDSSPGTKSKSRNKDKYHSKMKSQNPKELFEWDSHMNMQQTTKNRTKLKTPNFDESIESYAKACRAEFERKRIKNESEYYEKAIRKIIDKNQPIYTKPYSSDTYSDIQRIPKTSDDRNKFNRKDTADAYSSMSGSSDGFVSSNSISIGVAANSTTNTTTHQYDTKISVGIQTTNTLRRMQPIQLKKSIVESIETEQQNEKKCSTIRVNKLTMNKQLQVRPDALAYIIMFKDNPDQNGNLKVIEDEEKIVSTNRSKQNEKSNKVRKQSSKGMSSSDSLDSLKSLSSSENFTLQEYLQRQRPDFVANAELRRKCVNDLHNLRKERNELRKTLFAMNTCTNAKVLNRNMKRLLPPPPLEQIRIFTSKDIVDQTRRKYKKLPEIRQRQQSERDMKIRRNQRMLVNVFNKNLQKHVLSGRTDLSNSITIN